MRRSREFAASRITLEDGHVLTKCDQCRTMWRERNERGVDGAPPCETCRVDLDPENHEAAEIFNLVQGQVITRHNGRYDEIIDLNYPAVKIVMDLHGVRDQMGVFNKVLRVFHYFLEANRDENS